MKKYSKNFFISNYFTNFKAVSIVLISEVICINFDGIT